MLTTNTVLIGLPYLTNSKAVFWNNYLKICLASSFFSLHWKTTSLIVLGIPAAVQVCGIMYVFIVMWYLAKRPQSASANRRVKSRNAIKKLVLINVGNLLYIYYNWYSVYILLRIFAISFKTFAYKYN